MHKLSGHMPDSLYGCEKNEAILKFCFLYEDVEKEIPLYKTPPISVMHIGLIRALEECRPSHCLSVRHE